jgi:hypothetical protein
MMKICSSDDDEKCSRLYRVEDLKLITSGRCGALSLPRNTFEVCISWCHGGLYLHGNLDVYISVAQCSSVQYLRGTLEVCTSVVPWRSVTPWYPGGLYLHGLPWSSVSHCIEAYPQYMSAYLKHISSGIVSLN